jgi:transposase
LRIARLRATETDRRRDAVEKATTDLARRFDLIRVEDLKVCSMLRSAKGTVEHPGRNVRQKAGLNRSIAEQGWSVFLRRLSDKAPGRVEQVPAAFTSQRCARCGHVATDNRKSQAVFCCVACGETANADFNAARNIAAGPAVSGRGGIGAIRPPCETSSARIA